MKKILFIALAAFGMNANAQITLEHIYKTGFFVPGDLKVIHLTSAGYKFEVDDTTTRQIRLYNLNHSLFKVINEPIQTLWRAEWEVRYISDELFNTNPADIEYLLVGVFKSTYPGNPYLGYVRVYDETGAVLFARDTVSFRYGDILYTPVGVKMFLDRHEYPVLDSAKYVYGLPGILSCSDCANGVVSGIVGPNAGVGENEIKITNPYPNPAINSTRIDYTFPNGVNQGEIVFYDLQGKEVKRYKVDAAFDHLLISTSDIPTGTYFYQLQTSAQVSAGKKMVVIK